MNLSTLPLPSFTAVLLAGGKSSRMGHDKAGLVLDGQPLWQRQLATLRATAPGSLFISGKLGGPYCDAGVPILCDAVSDRGPLAGILAALNAASDEFVLVLAIDLPAMTPAFLSGLLHEAHRAKKGIVPQRDGWAEPLAAVYPRACLPLAEECLQNTDRSMQRFVRLAVKQGTISLRELSDAERVLFRNVNRPSD